MADQSLPPYKYQPIDAQNEIRVLSLLPSPNFLDPLEGRLLRRQLFWTDQALIPPPYEAISYCWGGLPTSLILKCGAQNLPITHNVDSVLRHLRKASEARILWVDALSINQTDAKEKGKQVQNMGTIFSRADKVHVWLGDAHDDDQIPLAFALLKEKVLAENNAIIEGQRNDGPAARGNQTALLASLLSRPWFCRRWVIQEVALSRNVVIRCGRYKASWNWVRDGAEVLYDENIDKKDALPLSAIYALENAVNLRPRTQSLLELLFRFHSSHCLDNRDRLFSLYSIISNESRRVLNPCIHCPIDYSNDWTSTYTAFATAAVEAGSTFDILSHVVAFGSLGQQNSAWPSWVPSWNRERFARVRFAYKRLSDLKRYAPYIVSVEDRVGLSIDGHLQRVETPQTLAARSIYVDIPDNDTFMCQLLSMLRSVKTLEYDSETLHSLENLVWAALYDVQQFYSYTDIDFGSIFGDVNAILDGIFPRQEKEQMDLLRRTLMDDLGFWPADSRLQYNKASLHHEINKIMDGHTIFYVTDGNSLIAGVAPLALKAGDYVFYPQGVYMTPYEFSFLLQPYTWPSTGHGSPARLFRLIGGCFVDERWSNFSLEDDPIVGVTLV